MRDEDFEQSKLEEFVEDDLTAKYPQNIDEDTVRRLARGIVVEHINASFPSYTTAYPKFDYSRFPTHEEMAKMKMGIPPEKVLAPMSGKMETLSNYFFIDLEIDLENVGENELIGIYKENLNPWMLQKAYNSTGKAMKYALGIRRRDGPKDEPFTRRKKPY